MSRTHIAGVERRRTVRSGRETVHARAQREAEVAHLGDEVNALKAQLRSTPPTGAAPVAASAVPAAVPAPPAVTEEPVSGTTGALFSSGEERAHPAWPWTLAAALIGFGAGFGLGALMLYRHIRRKYGGLRIY